MIGIGKMDVSGKEDRVEPVSFWRNRHRFRREATFSQCLSPSGLEIVDLVIASYPSALYLGR
jgi:hypothetical protein